MMMNIFSIFDPCTSSMLSLNWLSMLIVFMLIPFPMWIFQSRYTTAWNKLIMFLFKEFKILIQYSWSNLIILMSLFIMIMCNNFFGLFPYVFTSSSHMSFCLSLSLTMWMGMMVYSIINYFNDTCSHLTPQGTPIILMPFMVIIETISLVIRPMTLAIRLTANMIAGHLLMSLMGSSGQKLNILMLSMMLMVQILLIILEIGVSLIQAYVFTILSTLYSSEI